MTLNDPSSGTWISLDERPPPVSADKVGARCWCWFKFQTDPRPTLGYLNQAGRVVLLRRMKRLQNELMLDDVTHWKPMSEERLEEFDRRA